MCIVYFYCVQSHINFYSYFGATHSPVGSSTFFCFVNNLQPHLPTFQLLQPQFSPIHMICRAQFFFSIFGVIYYRLQTLNSSNN